MPVRLAERFEGVLKMATTDRERELAWAAANWPGQIWRCSACAFAAYLRWNDKPSTQTTVAAGARFEFPTGHLIDVHELWQDQWLYQVWPPGIENQGQFDRLARMPAKEFEQQVVARGGVRVR